MEHRLEVILRLIKLEFNSLLEIGCDGNALPNLTILRALYPHVALVGCDKDISSKGIERADNLDILLKEVDLNDDSLPFIHQCFDVVLSSAVMMYLDDVTELAKEIKRVTKKYIVISELDSFYYQDLSGPGVTRVARDYRSLFPDFNFEVIESKKEVWPGSTYSDGLGKILIGTKI